jgi:hypothetical protein
LVDQIQQELSQISESEKDDIEHEILMSKSDLSRDDYASIPDIISDGPLTRSRTKQYIVRRHQIKHSNTAPATHLHFQNRELVESSVEEESPRENVGRFSPLKERVMTPMKKFARQIQNRVKNTHFINSELFTNAVVLGFV